MGRFYVYLLYRDESKTDPFYVGNGMGRRMHRHESQARHAVSEKTRALIGEKNKNRIISQDTREKLRQIALKQWERQKSTSVD